MAKTLSYRIKTTPKLFVHPPSAWLKLFASPLFAGVKLHVPPHSRFVAPPLPVISDQSLMDVGRLTSLICIMVDMIKDGKQVKDHPLPGLDCVDSTAGDEDEALELSEKESNDIV